MSLIDILVSVAAGIGSGIFVGMFPGIGTGVFVAMLLPLLFELDLATLFLFYFSLMASTQYYGSIVAIVFGIPGEISSVPAVRHGHQLFQTHRYHLALCDTATASLIASMISLSLFGILGYFFLDIFIYFLRGWVIVTLLTLTMVMMILTSGKPILATVMTVLGLVLGKVGLAVVLDMRFLTFSWSQLDSGIPLFPLLCGFIVVPLLVDFDRTRTALPSISQTQIPLDQRFTSLMAFDQWRPAIRGSMIGFVVGLIPGASYLVSSAVADNVEGRVSKNNQERSMLQLISAEAANNAGAISALIPLTILGVPILLSEAIILGVAESQGFNYNTSMAFFKSNVDLLIMGLAAVSIANWFVAGVFFNSILRIYQRIHLWAYRAVMVLCVMAMIWFAIDVMMLESSLLVFSLALISGLIIKNIPVKFCLIVAFIISPMYIDEIYRIFFI